MIDIRTTDKRHTGHQHFKYVLEVKRGISIDRIERLKLFDQIRIWSWDTWGPSTEREHWLTLKSKQQEVNSHWAWHTEFTELKIYLATDKEANWAKLKWI